jgi:hypothetical protein
MQIHWRFMLVSLALVGGIPAAAPAEEPCTPLKWDVARERALFAGAPKLITAAPDASAAPALAQDALYELALKPQDQLILPVAARKGPTEGVFAGLARLHVTAPGTYRIALAASGWIEVIGEHGALPAGDHAGGGCEAPHKVVQFDLPAGELLLQLSGVATPQIRLTVTRAP